MASTLIIYTTQHGTTKKVANLIQNLLNNDANLCNLQNDKPNLENYKKVILGGSIHAGKIQKRLFQFMQKHEDILHQKELGLFLCCMQTQDSAQLQFDKNFPEMLRQHAKATSIVGGAFDFEQMNFLEKAIIKKVANITDSVNKINTENIKRFVAQFIS